MDYLTLDENVCPVCGKVFYTALGRDWGWSYKGNNYCSYHCMRHIEVRHRLRMGWAESNWHRTVYDLSPAASVVAADMKAMRHAVQAARHLAAASMAPTMAAASGLGRQSADLVQPILDRHKVGLEALDMAQRHLMEDLFVKARPIGQVAGERHIDTDLLGVKLCMAYETMAKAER